MAGNIGISVLMSGVKEFKKSTAETQVRVDKATISALRENQRILKLAIRRNMRGKPRWNQRGKSKVYTNNYRVPGMEHNEPRSGGPGRFSGALYSGVGSARPKPGANGDIVGGVGIGGKINNFKKGKLERDFPYFRPAVEVTEPKMLGAYEKGWGKAIDKMGGIL